MLNEGTAYPWWAIVDPRRGLPRNADAVHFFASAISGPFFSRASAEAHLECRRYAFGPLAAVYCFSGHMSYDYRELLGREENR